MILYINSLNLALPSTSPIVCTLFCIVQQCCRTLLLKYISFFGKILFPMQCITSTNFQWYILITCISMTINLKSLVLICLIIDLIIFQAHLQKWTFYTILRTRLFREMFNKWPLNVVIMQYLCDELFMVISRIFTMINDCCFCVPTNLVSEWWNDSKLLQSDMRIGENSS